LAALDIGKKYLGIFFIEVCKGTWDFLTVIFISQPIVDT
jgi:hypothetical protein